MKPNNFFYVKCASDVNFLRSWMEFTTPYHHLTSREKDVAARILEQYFKFLENMPDLEPDVRRELLWSRTSRRDMMASLKMTQANFQMTLQKLRKSGFLMNHDGDIAPHYIPHPVPRDNRLLLQVFFDWSSDTNPIKNAQPS